MAREFVRSREAKGHSGSGGAAGELGDGLGDIRTLNCELELEKGADGKE